MGLRTLPPSCVSCLRILGASTSWHPLGLCRHVQGQLYRFYPSMVRSSCHLPSVQNFHVAPKFFKSVHTLALNVVTTSSFLIPFFLFFYYIFRLNAVVAFEGFYKRRNDKRNTRTFYSLRHQVFEKPTIARLLTKNAHPEYSFQCSQKPFIGPRFESFIQLSAWETKSRSDRQWDPGTLWNTNVIAAVTTKH